MDFVAFSDPNTPGVDQWKRSINNQANASKIPPCALAAIVMRESGGRNVLQAGMPPGVGCGVGLTQVTSNVNWSNPNAPTYNGTSYNLLDPSSNLWIAAEYFLRPAIQECLLLREHHGDVMNAINPNILYFVFAAYNMGFGGMENEVLKGRDPDKATTNFYAAGTLGFYNDFIAASHRNHS